MIDQIQAAISSFEAVDKFRSLVGNALTRPQQLLISTRMQRNPEAFAHFAQSDAGRAAIRQLADTFINSDKEE